MNSPTSTRPWYSLIPHPVVMLLGILVVVSILTYILPAGEFIREEAGGRMRVVPGSYSLTDQNPTTLLGLFRALPLGFAAASPVVYVILASGIMFGALQQSKAIENGVAVIVRSVSDRGKTTVIVGMTFLFGMLGVFVGYENNIAMVPIAAVLALALGGDLMLAAGLSVGAITVGFGVSPFNPYTVGIGHQIAELPIFSGWMLRSVLCFNGLALLAWWNVRYFRRLKQDRTTALGHGLDEEGLVLSQPLASYKLTLTHTLVLALFVVGMGAMLYGVFNHGWFLNEMSAAFIMVTIGVGVVARIKPSELAEKALKSVAVVAPGAFLVGLANAVRIIMEEGKIGDTITYQLASALEHLPTTLAACGMVGSQSLTNFLIPSGSGQALATLPVMIPLGDLLGLTRQVTVLAFQIGDGVTNLVNPTLGGMVAMLALCRVPFDRWLRFILPVVGMLLIMALMLLIIAVNVGYT